MERDCILEMRGHYCYDSFYLPVIVKPRHISELAKKYFSEEVSIGHELMHVSDILRWAGEDPPAYIENVLNFGVESVSEDTLEKSVDFEIRKIFKLEPQAIGHDFDNGEDMIVEPFLFEIFLNYQCPKKKEFIRMKIADYVNELKRMYEKKFRRKEDEIERFFEESVGKYGKNVFGPSPYQSLLKKREERKVKMMGLSAISIID